jgi:glycosyltransferase involved in cell wall biosynthesis
MGELVSILIPCYNAERWIAASIQSALDQTYPDKEVVVVDDGSTDGSLDVIRGFGDRVRFESGPNRGGNAARNRLVELSRGSWISFLDADDYYLPRKTEQQMAVVASDPELDIVYSPLIELIELSGQMNPPAVTDGELYLDYIRWHPFSTIGMLLRKSALRDVGGWKADQPVCQEHELLLRCIVAGRRFKSLPEAVAVYRKVDGASISRRSPLRTLTQKMALTEKLEAYLTESGRLNEEHRQAISQARFEAARTAYAFDGGYALDLMQRVRRTQKDFRPRGAAAPFAYRVVFNLLGFKSAEAVAAAVRKWRA